MTRGKNHGTRTMIKQVKSNARKIGKMQSQVETKYVYGLRVYAASNVGNEQFEINGLFKGTDLEERIGQKVTLKGLACTLFYNNVGSTAGRFRILIIKDTQNNGSIAILDPSNFLRHTDTAVDAIVSAYNGGLVGNDKRFRILFDTRAHSMFAQSSQGQETRQVNKQLMCNVLFNSGNAGNGADIEDCKIFVYAISDSANNIWGFSSKISFTDV